MNEKTLALRLMAIAAGMLVDNNNGRPTTIKVNTARVNRAHNTHCMCPSCTSHRSATLLKDFTREPDGVQINVDRPRRENYISQHAWARDMSNYRMLIDQAKKCEWKSRIPSNIPPHVHANRRDWYEDNERIAPIAARPVSFVGFDCADWD